MNQWRKRLFSVAMVLVLFLGSIAPVPFGGTEASTVKVSAAETLQESSLTLGEVNDQWTRTIAPGVTQTEMEVLSSRGRQQIYLMEVEQEDLKITLEVGLSNGKVVGNQPTTGQALAVSYPGHQVVGGVNGDSYSTSPPLGIPTDVMIHNGELLTSPGGGIVLGIMENDEAIMGKPQVTVTMEVYGEEVSLDKPVSINKVNRPRDGNDLVLYTPMYAEDTLTDDEGTEVILGDIQGEWGVETSVTAEVYEVLLNEGSTSLDEGIFVLSGEGAGEDVLENLEIGDQVTIQVDISEPWEEVKEAIGGHPSNNGSILVQDGKLGPNLDQAVHPRTAVGIREDGSVFLLTVDGRQPGYSEGVTTTELAQLMLDLGAVDAMNLDGGGSTTFIARQPGDEEVSVQNQPSDGYERPVGNSLLVINTAEVGPLSHLVVLPDHLRLLAGSRYQFEVKGLDEAYHPVPLEGEVVWEASSEVGEIDEGGLLLSAASAASGTVVARVGEATGTSIVEVVDEISEIRPFSESLSVDPGDVMTIQVTAYDSQGRSVVADPEQFTWAVMGNIGTINERGQFTASSAGGDPSGAIRVSYQEVSTTISVDVGRPPVVLEDFEDGIADWTKSGARVTSVDIAWASAPEPVRFGEHSLKLMYDFTGQTGTSGAYAHTREDVELEGYPEKIGMWVYGDGNGHWLRAQMRDGANAAFPIDFTPEAIGVNWTGWRYVEAAIPKGKTTPLKMDLQVRYMETNDNEKDAGALYIDQIRALYGEVEEDTAVPQIFSPMPEPENTVDENQPEIRVQVEDDSGGTGIDPETIEMKLDGEIVTPAYDADSRTISYVPEQPLADGLHQVWVAVRDQAGNPAELNWSFQISAGGPELILKGPEVVDAGSEFALELNVKNLSALTGAAVTLRYDFQFLEVKDADETIPGVQLLLNDRLEEGQVLVHEVNPEQGRIQLEVTGLDSIEDWSEVETLASIPFQVSDVAAGMVEVSVESGTLQLEDTEESLSILPPPYQATIGYGLNLSVDRASTRQPSTFTVTDMQGHPVEGAAVYVLEPTQQVATVQVSGTLNIRAGSGTEYEILTSVPNGQRLLVLSTSDNGWHEVILPDGTIGWGSGAYMSVETWGSPLGVTDAEGELTTEDFSLAAVTMKLQAVKEAAVSAITEVQVSHILGGLQPEHLVLTWQQDPKTTQSFTWRTSPEVTDTFVEIVPTAQFDGSFLKPQAQQVEGQSFPFTTNVGEMQIHEVEVTGLQPGTSYTYRVGDGTDAGWSEPAEFKTEAAGEPPFTFLFTSDTQAIPNVSVTNGYGIWGEIFGKALTDYPDARFMLLSGDVVDYGDQQEHWEYWFDAAKDYLPSIPMVPTLGNHDVIGSGEENFKFQFQLPENGPAGEIEQAYSFDYSNTHIAVLNTEGDMQAQADWLRQDMNNSEQLWKIVSFHRSPYHSHESRDSMYVREAWTPVFDEVGVDLVLSGHDHAYMRSWPLYNGQQVEEGAGTTYIIGGTAGPKFYEMGDYEWIRVGFDENIQIYSGVTIDGNELTFNVTTRDGRTVDAFTMVKEGGVPEPTVPQLLLNAPKEVAANGTFEMEITVSDVEDLYGVAVEFSFDPAQLQVVDADADVEGVQITPDDWLTGANIENEVENETGTIRFTVTQLGEVPGVSGEGVLATATLRASEELAAGATVTINPIAGSVQMANSQNEPIEVELVPVELTVTEGLSVSGQVVVPSTHRIEDLSGFTVKLFDGAGQEVDRTTTDVEGHYSLSALEAGDHQVSVERTGYLSAVAAVTVTETGAEVEAIPTYIGDFNGDQQIDLEDIGLLAREFRQAVGAENQAYDVDADGDIDLFDVIAVARNFAKGGALPNL